MKPKPSEVMRIIHDKIQTVPPDAIAMQYYRANKHAGPCAFYSPMECGSQGCLIGWAATTPELAPLPGEYNMMDGHAFHLDFITYSLRILGIHKHWSQYPLYNELFTGGPTEYPPDYDIQKEILLRKLLVAEEALIRAEEDPSLAWHYAIQKFHTRPPFEV